jgi:hypothetical protein
MTQYKLKYRAVGKADYEFTFAWLAPDNCWRVYIEDQPLYRGRNTSDVSTHRLGLGSRPYVCWDRPLPTYEDARAVAALWADCTQQYIATGFFVAPPGRGPVNDTTPCSRLSEQQLRAGPPPGPGAFVRPVPLSPPTPNRSSGPIRRLLERLG